MVWINEVCRNEMGFEDELVLHTSTEFSKMLESQLIQTLYMWSHMPANMIVGHVMYSPLAVHNSGIGLQIDEDILQSDKANQIVSHEYHNRLENEESLEMIQNPVIIHDNDRTEDIFAAYLYIFFGVMDVERRGVHGFWFAPWDDLVMLCGAREVLLNLALKPDFMHKAI